MSVSNLLKVWAQPVLLSWSFLLHLGCARILPRLYSKPRVTSPWPATGPPWAYLLLYFFTSFFQEHLSFTLSLKTQTVLVMCHMPDTAFFLAVELHSEKNYFSSDNFMIFLRNSQINSLRSRLFSHTVIFLCSGITDATMPLSDANYGQSNHQSHQSKNLWQQIWMPASIMQTWF